MEQTPGLSIRRRSIPRIATRRAAMYILLMILLVFLLLGALPAWPYSRGWGYYPSGGIGLVLLVLIILLLLGVI